MNFLILSLLSFTMVVHSEAGLRCALGDVGCTVGCVLLGKTSGICDGDGNCHCSEKSIGIQEFKDLLPSRCDLGDKFCEGTCNAIGRRNGTCTTLESGKKDCTCSDDYLTPKEFALCAAETTCYLNCKAQGLGSGKCVGWKCTCEQKDEL
ncbi:uncharacterized protein LOC111696498 [Eurytemora carolleeae]|uniref:uncharacterized protein LOC111696498 n=1 Tax=Eurytemora carolleeae TaxID=1294199 RepID=UPI000C791518|nr:uncharacterized protein LOC111696498 [Eurytemora carolleeae]|eukprot:XP_023321879.1 uncharacterized protein LOC111696498 [Eurytemora affinis]